MPGMGELLIILVIVLLIFGAGKLPAIGDALGRSIKNFRRTAGGNDEIEVSKDSSKKGEELKNGKKHELDEGSREDEVEEAEVVSDKAKEAEAHKG